jgi:asparagine synthase (glutamine-hydrolysing)
MKDMLPEPILSRSKKGFPVPAEHWLRTSMRDYVHDMLLSSGSACGDHLDRGVMAELVREHESGEANRHQEIWSLLVLESWHRLFIGRRSRRPQQAEPAIEVLS